MSQRVRACHVATITKRGRNGNVYTSHLVRRTYRENGKVKHETLCNISDLPLSAIDALRRTLAGKALVDLDEQLAVTRSLPHGHVQAVLGVIRELDLVRVLSRERSRERDLAVAMVCQLVIDAGSKLSMTRRFSQTTLCEELGLGEVSERELLGAMDWLGEQQDRVQRTFARRHLADGSFVLYDLSSSYVEGRCCPLAAFGHNRDGKRGKQQVNWGLVCDPDGRPVAVQVHAGNMSDPETIPGVLEAVRARFGIERVVLVGDRAMITQAHAKTLIEHGEGFVSALKSQQIQGLVDAGDLQLSLFDEVNIAEICSPRFPGERLVVCRNPLLAAERERKRNALLEATEKELEHVKRMVHGPRGTLRDADAGTIGKRVGKNLDRHKVAKHFTLTIADGTFSYERRTDQIKQEAALDGFYVLRTTCPPKQLTTQAVVRVYKQLKMAERGYRTIKSTLDVRPIRHHLQDRVECHFFLFLLAYYVLFELHARLTPMLYTDETPISPVDPVAPAQRSATALAKTHTHRTPDGDPVYSLPDLIAELGTIVRNDIQIAATHTYKQTTVPTAIQAKALQLLAQKPRQ